MKTTFRILFVIAFAAVTVISLIPNPADAPSGGAIARWLSLLFLGGEQHADKVNHFVAYAALGGLGALSQWPVRRVAVLGPLGLALWGVVMEGGQGFLAARQTDGVDAVANASGAALGWAGGLVLIALVLRLRPKRNSA